MPLGSYGNEEEILGLLRNSQTQTQGLGQRFMGAVKPMLGNSDFALALLANSGYSPNKRSFGEILGTSALQSRGMKSDREQQAMQRQLLQAQIANIPNQGKTSNVRDYEFLKRLSPDEQTRFMSVAGGQSGGDPSEVRAFKYWDSLDPEKQQDFLKLKRNVGSDYAIETVNGVPTVVYKPAAGDKGRGGTPLVTPLTNLPAQAAGAGTIKEAEGRGGAIGKGVGEIETDITKKGSNAKSTIATIDLAEPLIDAATGSSVGAGRDKLAAFFGEAPKGAQAIAQLQVLQANLMTSMPRMEGPQSDRDVELYRQAAGQIGDPNIPKDIKKAAVQTIRALQNKYVDRASRDAPKKLRYNPSTGKIE